MDSDLDALAAHYTARWSCPPVTVKPTRGRAHELPADFRVLVFRRRPTLTSFATAGMSLPNDGERLELHLHAPGDADEAVLVDLLSAVAHYHRTGARLGLAHTVNFGTPWLPGSSCTHGLILLPYLDGAELEWVDRPRVRCLWLVPITRAELDFKKQHGAGALEERFDAAKFAYLDPLRASVV